MQKSTQMLCYNIKYIMSCGTTISTYKCRSLVPIRQFDTSSQSQTVDLVDNSVVG